MTPFLLALIVGVSGTATGRSEIRLDYATFLETDSTQRIELNYTIPYPSVTFLRDSTGYAARFVIRVQCFDAKGQLLAARDWSRVVTTETYDQTMRENSVASGSEEISAPLTKLTADVTYQDQQSERTKSWDLKIEPPTWLSDIRLQPKPDGTPFESRDTVRFLVETYDRKSEIESCLVRITKDRRVWAAGRRAIPRDTWRSAQSFVFSLRDFEDGVYDIAVEVVNRQARVLAARHSTFRVVNSFFRSNRAYKDKVDQLIYIATDAELKKLRGAQPAERESLWSEFWRSKDKTPTTEENELEKEYFTRIDYAIEHFGHGDRGYKSDRGHMYVKLGPPDYIESLPFERNSNGYEIWYYYSQSLKFTFEDVSGFGEYKLVDPADWFRRNG